MFREQNNIVPSTGYIFAQWGTRGYRSTAVAYMQREGLFSVENANGNWYSLAQLQGALLGPQSISNLNQ